jgi:hypothetical protein
MAQYGPPLVDFSALGDIGTEYRKGQEYQTKSQFEDAIKAAAKQPGPVDFNALVKNAMSAGYTPGIELGAKLKQAEAANQYHLGTLAETKRYHDILAGQVNKPIVHWNPHDPLNPDAPLTGVQVITDKNGNTRMEPISVPRRAAPPQQQTTPPPDDPWAQPMRGPSALPGQQGSLPGAQGGPALAQAPGPFPVSPSDQLIAQAQQGGPP